MASSGPVGVGFIGTGMISDTYLENLTSSPTSRSHARCGGRAVRGRLGCARAGPGFLAALAALLFARLAWMAVTTTLAAELQLFLPVWVRARGLAVYMIMFTGSMTAGALLWGLVAEGVGLRATFLAAAVVLLVGVVAGLVWRVPSTGHLDPQPIVYWPEARLAFDPDADAGPILVTVEFIVTQEREAPFLEAMGQLRRSRRRTGASRWDLYRDGDRPDRFVEVFSVPSWEEHLRPT